MKQHTNRRTPMNKVYKEDIALYKENTALYKGDIAL